MKTLVRSVLFTGVLMAGASGLMAGQASDNWIDQFYRAKLGRSSPAEEARQKAERANTAFRLETTAGDLAPTSTWLEDFWKAKLGRSSPAEQDRQRAERENTAFREEATPGVAAPANTWFEDYFKAKYGRSSPRANTK